jgi:hypothetical protein
MMERKAVTSGAISAIGYDEATETLEVCFPSGAVWRYFGVQPHSYDEFVHAESLGRFFAMFIRANFPSQRVHDDQCADEPDEHTLNCDCWCHKERKDVSKKEEAHAQVPNPSLAKDLRKSIKQAKKRVS